MTINDNDISRFLAGQMADNDPARAEVAAFLQRLDAVYPTASTTAMEADHLAAVIQEARQVRETTALRANTSSSTTPSKPPRLAIAALAAALIALTAGVGVAAAMGGSFTQQPAAVELAAPPVAELASPTPDPSSAAPSPTKVVTDDDQASAPKPRVNKKPAPKPSKSKSSPKASDDDDHGDEDDHEDEGDDDDKDEDD